MFIDTFKFSTLSWTNFNIFYFARKPSISSFQKCWYGIAYVISTVFSSLLYFISLFLHLILLIFVFSLLQGLINLNFFRSSFCFINFSFLLFVFSLSLNLVLKNFINFLLSMYTFLLILLIYFQYIILHT